MSTKRLNNLKAYKKFIILIKQELHFSIYLNNHIKMTILHIKVWWKIHHLLFNILHSSFIFINHHSSNNIYHHNPIFIIIKHKLSNNIHHYPTFISIQYKSLITIIIKT